MDQGKVIVSLYHAGMSVPEVKRRIQDKAKENSPNCGKCDQDPNED